MSLAEFTVGSDWVATHRKKLLVWESNHPDQVEPVSVQDADTVTFFEELPVFAGIRSVQVPNDLPFLVPEKFAVILTSTVDEPESVTDTFTLTVHEVSLLQLLPNWPFPSSSICAS